MSNVISNNSLITTPSNASSSLISSTTNIIDTSTTTTNIFNDPACNLWGSTRLVVLDRLPNKSLGISIVGGKLDVFSSTSSENPSENVTDGHDSTSSPINDNQKQKKKNSNEIKYGTTTNSFISGIFVKHVLENSPAGQNGILKTGDRILSVNDIDLTQATHDRAVEVIRNAQTPVCFKIQSLVCNYQQNNTNELNETDSTSNFDSFKKEEENNDKQDNILNNIPSLAKQIIDEPNKYNYTQKLMEEKYNFLINDDEDEENDKNNDNKINEKNSNNKILIFKLERKKSNMSLGLSLSGNMNVTKTSVFVCGIYENSIAAKQKGVQTGDQILEINGNVLYGKAHSNVTPLIKNIKDLDIYLVILR